MPKTKHTYIFQKLKYQLFIGWLIFGIVHFLILHYEYGINAYFSAIDSFLSGTFLLVVIVSVSQFLTFYQRRKSNFFYAWLITTIESVISTFIIIFLLKKFHHDPYYMEFLNTSLAIRLILSALICNSVVNAILLLNKIEEKEEERGRDAGTKEMIKEAELQKLQQQLQPHFLFNSLNSINALIISNPGEAGIMIQKLSDFLRYTSKTSDEQWINLKEELKYLELYLDIEKIRFGHRLEVEKQIEDKCLENLIPTMILQPIVENAIKFGLYGTTDKVKIQLSVNCENNTSTITVTNPFDEDALPPKGTGFGLNGIKRRLYLLYTRNDLLQTQTNDCMFICSIKIPEKK